MFLSLSVFALFLHASQAAFLAITRGNLALQADPIFWQAGTTTALQVVDVRGIKLISANWTFDEPAIQFSEGVDPHALFIYTELKDYEGYEKTVIVRVSVEDENGGFQSAAASMGIVAPPAPTTTTTTTTTTTIKPTTTTTKPTTITTTTKPTTITTTTKPTTITTTTKPTTTTTTTKPTTTTTTTKKPTTTTTTKPTTTTTTKKPTTTTTTKKPTTTTTTKPTTTTTTKKPTTTTTTKKPTTTTTTKKPTTTTTTKKPTTTTTTTTTTLSPPKGIEGPSELLFVTPTAFTAEYKEKCEVDREWSWRCTYPYDSFIHMVASQPSDSEIILYLKYPNKCVKAMLYHTCKNDKGAQTVKSLEFKVETE